MSVFAPARRWQPAYRPFRRESTGTRALAALERAVKGPVYGCRMCGNCLLQETAFICPMECPSGLRNGPCGGSTPDHCYVDETRPCVWNEIYERSFAAGREEKLLEVLPPLDWDKVGGPTWGDVLDRVKEIGPGDFLSGMRNAHLRSDTWDSVFRPVRQPGWWNGDSTYHPPAYEEPVTGLERRLRSGEFVVTSEVAPPLGTATGKLVRDIEMLKPYVTAVNFTDCPSATSRMSSLACCLIALQHGVEPIMQIAARDRTRVGLQAEVIGAAGLGIGNVLCLSGDNPAMGPSPRSRMDIIDLDSIQMLWMLRRMRDEGTYLDGRTIKNPPMLFLGAAAAPFASRPHFQALREQKKVNAGGQFFQTNLVYDPARFAVWLDALAKRDVLDKVHILVGITPLKSYKMARYLHDEVPGVVIPDHLLERMESAGEDGEREGVQIALELIEEVKRRGGVQGIHLMPVMWEAIVPRLVTEAGLLPPDFTPPPAHEDLVAAGAGAKR